MGEWIDFERWPDCKSMERPGIVFEVTNGEQTLFTGCVVPLPLPFDWEAQPKRFRAVPQRRPRHSSPIPEPLDRWLMSLDLGTAVNQPNGPLNRLFNLCNKLM